MVRATGAELGQPRGVDAVDEAEDRRVGLHGADEPLLLAHLPAQPRQDRGQRRVPLLFGQRLILRAAEGLVSLVVLLDVAGGLLDQGQGQLVARLVVVGPVDEAVLPHDEALGIRVLLLGLLHEQAELETGPHPRNPDDLVAVDLAGQLLGALRRGDADGGIRMRVIDMLERQEAVERRVDAAGARIQVERGVAEHADHRIFERRLHSLGRAGGVDGLQTDQLLLIERREVLAEAGAEIAAGTLDPEDLDRLAREGVLLDDLGAGVAAAGVGDALVGAEDVGAIDEPGDRIHLGGDGVVPEVVDETVIGGLRHGSNRFLGAVTTTKTGAKSAYRPMGPRQRFTQHGTARRSAARAAASNGRRDEKTGKTLGWVVTSGLP